MNRKRLLLFFIISICITSFAQDIPKPEDVFESTLIKNVTIVIPGEDKIENGSILIDKGIIKSFGKDISPLPSSFIFDGKGYFLYPGLINGGYIFKPDLPVIKDSVKFTPGNPPDYASGITPEHEAEDFIFSEYKNFEKQNEQGITTALALLDLKYISGQPAVLNLHKEKKQEHLFLDDTGLFIRFKPERVYPATTMGMMSKLRQLFEDAKRYKEWSLVYNRTNSNIPRPPSDEVSKIFNKVLEKKIPVLFEANKENEILRALKLKEEFEFNLIILGGSEAWKVTNELKAANVPVIAALDLPEKQPDTLKIDDDKKYLNLLNAEEFKLLKKRQEESRKDYWMNAAMLKKTGVNFAFGLFNLKPEKLKNNLIELKNFDLSEDDILKAMGESFSEIFNSSDKLGGIREGHAANFFLTDKEFFNKDSKVKYVFIDGVKYKIETKDSKKKNDK